MNKNLSVAYDFFRFSFSEEEQKEITKALYVSFKESAESFIDTFLALNHFPYRIMFGDIGYSESMDFLLSKFYRNEYFVKRRFVRQEHSSFFRYGSIEELPVAESRVDLAGLDSNYSYAFEIKTKYDTLERLGKQIDDYAKCFEMVYVISSADRAGKILSSVPDYCGLITYEDRANCRFRVEKKATDSPVISEYAQLSFLLKSERDRYFGDNCIEKIAAENCDGFINQVFKEALKGRIEKKLFRAD